jgi:Phage tail tube protein, GTA-gp10
MSGAMMSGANPARGEASIDLPQGALAFRPTFAALVAAEDEIGPLFVLVDRVADGALSLSDLIALFWHCRADAAHWPDRDAFADALCAAGLVKLTPALRTLVAQILQGR